MKIKVKAYNMSVDEVLFWVEKRGYDLCKSLTPENYDYRYKYIHYLEGVFGEKIVITAKSYNSAVKVL